MCNYIEDTNVHPGWGCCRCRSYNGLQRDVCGRCGAPPCESLAAEIPSDLLRCPECGLGFRPNFLDASVLTSLGKTVRETGCPVCGTDLTEVPAPPAVH